jgi:predicted O-linked N-acetylglucosamine transferase (SPINDLY family)
MSNKPPSSIKAGPAPSPQAIQLLTALLNQGQFARCEQQARVMTVQFAGHAFGWSMLGVCLAQMGRFSEAVVPMQKAVSLQPSNAGLHNNLGNILSSLGRPSEAEACFRRALALQSDSAEMLNSLGTTLGKLGRPAEAEVCFRRALALQPDSAETLNNLGTALSDQDRFGEAEDCFRRALTLKPDFAHAHSNLGSALKSLSRFGEAEVCFRHALVLEPDFVHARNNLGSILLDLGRAPEAETCFRRALALQPDSAEVLNNLGTALGNLGRLDEAETCFRRAFALQPDSTYAHNNLGNALRDLCRLDEAETCFRRALALDPDFTHGLNNLGSALIDMSRLDEAEVCFRRALALQPDFTDAHSNLLFCLNCRSDAANVALDEARKYGRCVGNLAATPYTDWLCEAQPRRLRVGIVSGDLREHVVGYFLESLLSELNPEHIELLAYPTQPKEDRLSQRLRTYFAAWRSLVGLSDAVAAARIHADGVHVLLDLSGHTAHNRLPIFAYKPAPVQASWLGYLATTGVAAMDYLIADSWTLPTTEDVSFTEKIWRLPETYLCFTPPELEVAVSSLPALTEGRVTFGSFNSLTKMTDEVVALWARVLAAVPDSRLFLKTRPLMGSAVRQGVVERFATHGIGSDRLMLEGPVPTRTEHLATYHRMDIALDPFPYSGITTSAEALWMGVPVLTLAGDRFLSRQGVGLMMNTGLPEWIASDPDDYVARAVKHAGDLQGLVTLRASLRDRFLASPLCDAKHFARHFEQALEGMWRTRVG